MIYLLRHCKTTSQAFHAHLTEDGVKMAKAIIPKLEELNIDEIHSSPMLRAVETIQPFSAINNINIQLHDELQERILSQIPLEDWKSELQKTFLDFEYKINGGESSKEALLRILNLVNQLDETKNHIIVSHGDLLSLLINYYDSSFGFGNSLKMKNPALYKLMKNTVKEISL